MCGDPMHRPSSLLAGGALPCRKGSLFTSLLRSVIVLGQAGGRDDRPTAPNSHVAPQGVVSSVLERRGERRAGGDIRFFPYGRRQIARGANGQTKGNRFLIFEAGLFFLCREGA